MKEYKAFFFDLDGTITDPGMGITNAVMYSLRHYGIEIPERWELYKFIGPPLMDSYRRYYGFDEEGSREAMAVYREYYGFKGVHENTLYDGIRELLESLRETGKIVAVCSSKPEEYVKMILEDFNLTEYFNFIGGSDMAETRADKAAMVAYNLEQCGITDPADVLMIGDRSHDIFGAKNNGVDALGVAYGYGSREELKEAGADYIADTVKELREFLLADN